MEWTTILSILVPMIGFFGFLYKEIKDWRKETRDEIKETKEEIKQIRRESQEEIRLQAQRSDKLYQMFIDLLERQTPKTRH